MHHLPVPAAGPAHLQDNAAIGGGPEALRLALSAAETFARGSKSAATARAYASDWADFSAWCAKVEVEPLEAGPAIVAAYLAALAGRGIKPGTIKRRVSAIRDAYRTRGLTPPTAHDLVKAAHTGIRRSIGTRVDQKAPATAKAIGSMLKRIPADTLAGRRDRALLLLGFAGALRRSELVGLDVEHLARQSAGVMVTIARSKTDQEGAGQTVAIPNGTKLRPVEALFAWLAAAEIRSGPIFRRIRKGDRLTADRLTDHAVALIVKRWAAAAKLDPATFAGHSLRAGFVTSALEAGADVFAAADQGRWRKLETVREYDRRAKAFTNHAGKGFL